MKTIVKLTPQDHGRYMTAEEWDSVDILEEGARYEIIDGVVQVAPAADFDHDGVCDWLNVAFVKYRLQQPEQINHISQHARVRVPDRPDLTEPQPDFSLFRLPDDLTGIHWRDIEPFLVVEIISEGYEEKDIVRNVELYLQVPGIREYWIIDPRSNWMRPNLTVYRRRGNRWQKPIEVAFGEVYETPKLLPGFSLVVDPRAT